jgi:predicted RNA polymerase sigma factor
LKLGRYAEARDELQRAIAMTENHREHELLSKKLRQIPNNSQDANQAS